MSHKWKTELHLFADSMQGIPCYTHSPVGGGCVERRAETKQTWPLLKGTTCSLRQCYFGHFLIIRRKRSFEAQSSLFYILAAFPQLPQVKTRQQSKDKTSAWVLHCLHQLMANFSWTGGDQRSAHAVHKYSSLLMCQTVWSNPPDAAVITHGSPSDQLMSLTCVKNGPPPSAARGVKSAVSST